MSLLVFVALLSRQKFDLNFCNKRRNDPLISKRKLSCFDPNCIFQIRMSNLIKNLILISQNKIGYKYSDFQGLPLYKFEHIHLATITTIFSHLAKYID